MCGVSWNKKAFQSLVLDERKKELIHALVTVHLATNQMSDIIEGKGNGLILLLHGPPGTGKTLTAESVAEIAEKPLYRVTCGDIGTNATEVERYLESIFHIGSRWGCVVLLDEADVFLEERSKTDLERNALVSVFLRALEYYEGIIILTSNRVGTFDEAFKSRIQLAMYYPPLDEQGRFKIWGQLFDTLETEVDNVDISGLRTNYRALAQYKLNGRQIRNTVKTARQLALYRKEVLGLKHPKQAIAVASEFEAYIRETHGHSDAEYAQDQGLRHELTSATSDLGGMLEETKLDV